MLVEEIIKLISFSTGINIAGHATRIVFDGFLAGERFDILPIIIEPIERLRASIEAKLNLITNQRQNVYNKLQEVTEK